MKVIDSDRWRVLEPLLDQALDLSPAEQSRWLAELRTTSPDLASDVALLLAGETDANRVGFLTEPPETPRLEATLVGQQLGAYQLERPLGSGGMGSVWLARRADGRFEGVAAVKLLNLALMTEPGQQRFEREGSVLARLTHPGIARLLDAGLANGQPYLVLEHIDGKPIDRFAEEHHLTIEQRIRLVLQVLAAVGHAHAQLIVHRDLKPSNILVSADGMAKLLDFGIAKLLDAQTEGAELTAAGGRALTPEYAAPEQVRGDDVSTATDLYALGVILFTLLTGRRPYQLAGQSRADIDRTICDVEPIKPSEAAPHLRKRLQGDLDAIVMKALRKEPERRYQTAAALADDLQRFLDGRPVDARPDSTGYRMRKFLGRHRWGIGAAVAIVLLLSGYLVTVMVQRGRIQSALAQATLGERKAEQVSDFMLGLFEASEQGRAFGDTVSARALLQRGLARARQLSAQPEIQAQMLDVVGRLHTQLDEFREAKPILEEALAIRRRVLNPNSPEIATSLENLGVLHSSSGDHPAAAARFSEALAIRERTVGRTHPNALNTLYRLGRALHMAGDRDQARRLLDEWEAEVAKLPPDAARADDLIHLAEQLHYRREYARAEPLYRQALAARRALFGERHATVAAALPSLGILMHDQKKFAEAEPLLRQAVEIQKAVRPTPDADLARMYGSLGRTLLNRNSLSEAESLLRERLALVQRFYGHGHLQTGMASKGLGDALFRQGRFTEAEPLLLAAFNNFRTQRGLGRESYDQALAALIELYEAQGRREQAARYRAILQDVNR